MVELVAALLNIKPRYQVIPKMMIRIIGLFVPIMNELVEMFYI
jgi:hypothetical protein